jgi:hypothetical protein
MDAAEFSLFYGKRKELTERGGHDTYSPTQCYRPYVARLARIVIPGLPHHVTQRGNRREAIFFEDGDHEIYLDLLAEQTSKADVAVWACCLMPNHVHLILKPTPPDARWARPSSSPASKPSGDARSNAALQAASQFPQLLSPNS